MVHQSLNRMRNGCLFKVSGLLWTLVSFLAIAHAEPLEALESRLVSLRTKWAKNPGDLRLAEEMGRVLFGLSRREDASRALLSAHAAATLPADRKNLESLLRVVARTFSTQESNKTYQAGLNALAIGKLAVSESHLSAALASDPGHFDVLVRRGQVRWLSGNVDGAFEDFSHAKRIYPFEPESLLWLGISEIGRGERKPGAAQIQQALERSTPEQRRRPFWRAAQFLAGWELGLPTAKSAALYELIRAGSAPSWLLDELMSGASTKRLSGEMIQLALRQRPDPVLDTDGPSGVSLNVWQPEKVRERWLEIQKSRSDRDPSFVKPRG